MKMLTHEASTQTVLGIDRRSNLEYDEFAATYLYANKPVIVTDALRQWKALDRWTPEFFRREFGNVKFTVNALESGQRGYGGEDGHVYTMPEFIETVLVSTNER